MSVKTALVSYLDQFEAVVPSLGGAEKPVRGFQEALKDAQRRSQVFFWVCVVVLVVLFLATLLTGILYFESLTSSGAGTIQIVFGATAGTAVVTLLRFGREHARAELVTIALRELRQVDEREFARLIASLARKWYGLETHIEPQRAAAG